MRELSKILEEYSPDVVGLSLRNVDSAFSYGKRSYYLPFALMVRTIKEEAPSCKLVVGGNGFSLFSSEIMKRNPEIDFGIIAEGEQSFAELLKSLDKPELAHNIVLRKNNRLIQTNRGEHLDFSNMPPIPRDLFALGEYRKYQYSMGLQSKRGCSFGCIFCPNTYLMGTTCRLRPPRKVVDEIEELANEHGVDSFYFVDAVFNSPLWHAREICREIIRRKLEVRWEADFRPELMNASFMKEAVRSGCRLFSFSPDGASDATMKMLGKNHTLKDVERTISLTSETDDANVSYSFLYDLPGRNFEQMRGLSRLIPEIMLRCRTKLRFISLTKIRIYPHTVFHEIALRQGKIKEHTDLLYPVHYESGSLLLKADLLPRAMRGSSIVFQRISRKLGRTDIK